MKLIRPYYTIIEQGDGLDGIYKQIELAGRTCYKSEDKITDTSAKEFVDRMVSNRHGAMLEFGTVYLMIPWINKTEANNLHTTPFTNNKYSIENIVGDYNYVTTNYRVIIENNLEEYLDYLCEPTEYHERRVCVKFITDRGISHELVRHRVFSFAQESTRFCDYSKDKFSHELTFIIPSWCTLDEGRYHWIVFNYGDDEDCWCGWRKDEEPKDTKRNSILGKEISDRTENYNWLLESMSGSESLCFNMINDGNTPQEARQVLPNALKTEINMCGFVSDWKHFFDLRDSEHAHPDMKYLASGLHKEFIDRKYI